MTLHYNEIYSAFLMKITAYSFLECDESYVNEQMCSWLHSAISNPRLRSKFTSFEIDDVSATVEFNLKTSLDSILDIEFVKDVLSRSMVISWIEPQIQSELLTKQLFTGKEEKFYAQANHLNQLQQLLSENQIGLSKRLRDYGYLNNSYIKE